MSGHRPGVFKRPAKPHKTWKGHRSKSAIDEENRGRLGVREITKSRNRSMSKEQRRQQAVQRRDGKRKAAVEEKRHFGGSGAPPTLATFISFSEAGSPHEFLNRLSDCDDTVVRSDGHNVTYFAVPRFKARLGFLTPDPNILDDVLDSLKVSDILALVWPLNGELSEWDQLLISAIKAHGIPTILNIVPGLSLLQSGKKREEARKAVQNTISKWNLNTDKLFMADSEADGLLLMRALIETKKKKLTLQKRRPHILVEELQMANEANGACTLIASGYLRGPAWNINRLVHIQGLGDFQMSSIYSHNDPHPLKQSPAASDNSPKLLAQANVERQESLQTEIVPDPMDAEQTWPDEHDIVDEDKLAGKQEKKKVPKGTSSYQAAWIVDSDEDEDEEEEEDDESDEEDDQMEGLDAIDNDEEDDMEDVNVDDAATEAASEFMDDEEIDMDEVEKYRKERENAQFPDEVDTPIDIPARVRFQKYRGLKSFRTSPWDPLENLPYDYARIFKFQNFKKTKKIVLNSIGSGEADETTLPGTFVSIHIDKVPTTFASVVNPKAPLVLYQLLPHEQKMSVVNMVIRKHPSCTVPIMSKQKLIFHVGFRKFEAEPIFSQHTNGDKFKMERFMPVDSACVASVFAPITFPPASVLVFRKDQKGRQELVGSGSVLDNNPDRIVLKRLVLSGHPFKINKRSVVCRYMFFNREDIEWFKPVEIHTPSGRRGHIKEPLGTHGHMKAKFDQQLNAQDTVMMSLYKRVFPKWTFNPRVEHLAASRLAAASDDHME